MSCWFHKNWLPHCPWIAHEVLSSQIVKHKVNSDTLVEVPCLKCLFRLFESLQQWTRGRTKGPNWAQCTGCLMVCMFGSVKSLSTTSRRQLTESTLYGNVDTQQPGSFMSILTTDQSILHIPCFSAGPLLVWELQLWDVGGSDRGIIWIPATFKLSMRSLIT